MTELNIPVPAESLGIKKRGKTKTYHVEGWYAIQKANELFGFDNWDYSITSLEQVYERELESANGPMLSVAYTANVMLEVRVGEKVVRRHDTGFSESRRSVRDPADAYDTAIKGAVTDGLKRCFRTFGPAFGLHLYDKDSYTLDGDIKDMLSIDDFSPAEQVLVRKMSSIKQQSDERTLEELRASCSSKEMAVGRIKGWLIKRGEL